MTTPSDIMKLEAEFWQSVVNGEPEKAAALLTEPAANVAMFGIHHFTPDEYIKMAKEGPAKLTAFTFSNEKVLFPSTEVAVATYEVSQSFEMNGKTQQMVCLDTTTWIKRGGKWLAVVHTETEKQNQLLPPA
ncbi:nuclear transport factor 2 family protein [Variovorax sp. 160MFSha2.1]|uniref:nuclear transport factor 2 family protein n=1 Tax=Variovorax sp. 160MFSha2.1 TaxID=3158367 RepID=UPI003AAC61A0